MVKKLLKNALTMACAAAKMTKNIAITFGVIILVLLMFFLQIRI